MNNQPCPRCGKQNPADVHTCTPLALKLADELETKGGALGCSFDRQAAELRRLHAENEAAHAVGIRQEQELMDCEALLRQALEALDTLKIALRVGMPEYGAEDQDELLETAITALRAAHGITGGAK